jgi:hypothetical protein
MKNKKPLIMLAIIILLALLGLVFYAFQISQSQPEKKVTPPITQKEKSTTESKDKIKNPELEKIKIEMEKLNNQSLETKEISEDENCEESEEAKKYEEEFIEKGEAQIADGLVIEKTTSYLKVKFSSASYTWVSKVNIDSKTSITKLNPGSENINISLDEIDLNSKVVIRTTGNSITEEEFEAESVIKVN